jgi:hypothetical protein
MSQAMLQYRTPINTIAACCKCIAQPSVLWSLLAGPGPGHKQLQELHALGTGQGQECVTVGDVFRVNTRIKHQRASESGRFGARLRQGELEAWGCGGGITARMRHCQSAVRVGRRPAGTAHAARTGRGC